MQGSVDKVLSNHRGSSSRAQYGYPTCMLTASTSSTLEPWVKNANGHVLLSYFSLLPLEHGDCEMPITQGMDFVRPKNVIGDGHVPCLFAR